MKEHEKGVILFPRERNEVINMAKEEEITNVLEKLRMLDNDQLMFIVGATNAFYLTQQQAKEQKKDIVEKVVS